MLELYFQSIAILRQMSEPYFQESENFQLWTIAASHDRITINEDRVSALRQQISGEQGLLCFKYPRCKMVWVENFLNIPCVPSHVFNRKAVKNTNFTLTYKFSECFSGNCPKTSISVKTWGQLPPPLTNPLLPCFARISWGPQSRQFG